jgi:cob(I)alamin adenosyltransferase
MGNRLSKIYTRTGDDGTTGLGDGARTRKDSPRVEALGTIDELNSLIGVMLAHGMPEELRPVFAKIQHRLFDLGGELGSLQRKSSTIEKFYSAWRHSHRIVLPPCAQRLPPRRTHSGAHERE